MNKFVAMENIRTEFEKNIENLFKIEGKIKEVKIISAYFDLFYQRNWYIILMQFLTAKIEPNLQLG